MNVIDARGIFNEKKIKQKNIDDKQSIVNIENAMIEKLRLYLHDEDFTERQIDINSINSRTSKQGVATISIAFGVKGKEELNKLIDKISQIESFLDIERTTG